MTLETTFFGPVSWYRQIACATENVVIDKTERFRKQTDRSRCRIATANGVQTLSVPLTYNNGDIITDVRISDHNNWRHLHWQALASAYGSSPFFEFYADDIRPFFEKKWDYLYDYNLEILSTMKELIGIKDGLSLPFENEITTDEDMKGKEKELDLPPYYQTFQARHGFLPNLSILDLLFNMGPESLLYLTGR